MEDKLVDDSDSSENSETERVSDGRSRVRRRPGFHRSGKPNDAIVNCQNVTQKAVEGEQIKQVNSVVLESSRPTKSQPKQTPSGSRVKIIIMAIVAIIIAIVAIIIIGRYVYFVLWSQTEPLENSTVALYLTKVRHNFEASLLSIESIFKKQTKDTWSRIRAVVRMTTAHQLPQSPGVISLIPSESAFETTQCLAKKLAEALSLAYNDTTLVAIDGNDVVLRDNVDEIKRDLDRAIRAGLQNEEHVVLLTNFDKIPAKSGMLLHGLCDNDNAPFKQAVFVLAVSENGNRNVNVDGVDAEVTASWAKDLSDETRQSLEARIGNTITVVLPESDEILSKIC